MNIEGAFNTCSPTSPPSSQRRSPALVVIVTGFDRADGIAALVVAAIMLRSSYGLLKASGRVFLEAAPEGMDPDEVGAPWRTVRRLRGARPARLGGHLGVSRAVGARPRSTRSGLPPGATGARAAPARAVRPRAHHAPGRARGRAAAGRGHALRSQARGRPLTLGPRPRCGPDPSLATGKPGTMLLELRVENLLLIDRAELRVGPGLTVVTGETGAGKTVLAHALDLLLGGRPRSGIVRPDAREAYVEGVFSPPPGLLDEEPFADLRDRLPEGEVEEMVLGRRVSAEGRTRAFVQGRSATADDLRALGLRLVAFYGSTSTASSRWRRRSSRCWTASPGTITSQSVTGLRRPSPRRAPQASARRASRARWDPRAGSRPADVRARRDRGTRPLRGRARPTGCGARSASWLRHAASRGGDRGGGAGAGGLRRRGCDVAPGRGRAGRGWRSQARR